MTTVFNSTNYMDPSSA